MTIRYVDSNAGAGAGDGTSWGDAYLSFSDAIAGALVAGDTLYVAHDHVKDYGNINKILTFPGTQLAPNNLMCLNSGTDVAAVTAVEKAVGGTAGKIEPVGNFTCVGVNYESGGAVELGAANDQQKYIDCYLKIGVDSTAAYSLTIQASEGIIEFENVDVKFSGSGQHIRLASGMYFVWNGGAVIEDSTAPNKLFDNATIGMASVYVSNVDLSLVPTALIDDSATGESNGGQVYRFNRCLLAAGVALTEDTIVSYLDAKMHGCDVVENAGVGSDPLRFEEIQHQRGSIYSDTGVKVTASALSAKLVATGNGEPFFDPLTFDLCERHMAANPTIRVELNIDNIELKDNECWIEIEYPDDDNPAFRNIDRTSKGVYDSVATLSVSAVAWTEAFGTEKPQYIEVTIAGGSAGLHKVKLCFARSSATTLYADPKVTVT